MSLKRTTWSVLLLALSMTAPVRGDIFHLTTGGRLEGHLLNPEQIPRKQFIVALPTGGTITLTRLQVRKVVGETQEQKKYKSLLPGLDNSLAGHLEMAAFCLENKLIAERTFHLHKALEFDPNHAKARAALGYSLWNGRWVTLPELKEAQGLLRYRGQWVTPQKVAMEEAADANKKALGKWNEDINRWRKLLRSPKNYQKALHNIKSIKDGRAAMAISEWIDEEPNQDIKLLLVDVLGELPGSIASQALVKVSIFDEHIAVREQAIDRMAKRPDRYRAVTRLTQELGSKSNPHVNNAAIGLGMLNDSSAVLPLIDALITTHKTPPKSAGGPGQVSAGFDPSGRNGGGTFSAGSAPKNPYSDYRNPEVLRALVTITDGQNFQYDKVRWRQWYDQRASPVELTLRREE